MVNKLQDFFPGLLACKPGEFLPPPQEDDGGGVHDIISLVSVHVVITVYLDQEQGDLLLLTDLFQEGSHYLAGLAPLGVEVHYHQFAMAGLETGLYEVVVVFYLCDEGGGEDGRGLEDGDGLLGEDGDGLLGEASDGFFGEGLVFLGRTAVVAVDRDDLLVALLEGGLVL